VNDRGHPSVGLIVVRAWTERGDRLRFRITRTVDVSSGVTSVSYVASKAEVLNEVRAWLESFVATR
jgi:hypothetical protein